MVMIWGEEREKNGVTLPRTEVRAGGLALSFPGRPGAKLKAAAQALEPRSEAPEMLRLFPAPSDPRD